MTTEQQDIKPTLGEEITELYSRVAKLNDITAAILDPNWGASVGIIPEGHPLYPEVLEPLPSRIGKPPAAAGVAPAADRTALRTAIAEAIRAHGLMHPDERVFSGRHDCCADAVLAVVPDPANTRAALERVRTLHQPTAGLGFDSDEDDTPGSYGEIAQVCGSCGKPDEYGVRWPCATVRAIDTELRRLAGEVQPETNPREQQPDTEMRAADPSWPRRAWELGLLHTGGDPHHCPACLKQPEPPANFVCPGDNTEVLANPQPAEEA